MSDYIYRPRFKFKQDDYNLKYYNSNNPMYDWDDTSSYHDYTQFDYYSWGRFWEIYDFYKQTEQPPVNLGYIRSVFTQVGYDPIIEEEYSRGAYWYDASIFNDSDPDFTLELFNTDNYFRGQSPSLGDIVCATDYREPGVGFSSYTGVVEEIKDNRVFAMIYLPATANKLLKREITDGYLDDVPIIGFIKNPIYTMYDNIIDGRELYWKLPFWMYKKLIERRRGL